MEMEFFAAKKKHSISHCKKSPLASNKSMLPIFELFLFLFLRRPACHTACSSKTKAFISAHAA